MENPLGPSDAASVRATDSTADPEPARPAGRGVLAVGLAVFAVAALALAATGHSRFRSSPDSPAEYSLWAAAVPPLVGILLIRLVPWRLARLDTVAPADQAARRRSRRELLVLVGLALAAPAAMLPPVLAGGSAYPLYHLVKVALFLLVPLFVLRAYSSRVRWSGTAGRPERLWRPAGAVRWWAPLVAVAVFGYLAVASPLAPPQEETDDVGLAFLVVAALLTFLTANVLEELFYRVLLQTRLEALLGRWAAILLSALLFALLHLPSQIDGGDAGDLPVAIGVVIVYQGLFGIFAGYLWARHRNIWILIAAHTVVNTLPLFL